jgi:hypothetical protein
MFAAGLGAKSDNVIVLSSINPELDPKLIQVSRYWLSIHHRTRSAVSGQCILAVPTNRYEQAPPSSTCYCNFKVQHEGRSRTNGQVKHRLKDALASSKAFVGAVLSLVW